MTRGLIFANGTRMDESAMRALIQPDDVLIAADGGLRHMRRLGLWPCLLIGDLDSLTPQEVNLARQAGVRVEQYPTHKDETDLELAVMAALRMGCTQLWIIAALGGRLDMTLANIFLLQLPMLAGLDARLEDGQEQVFLVPPGQQGRHISGQMGDRLSLLPLGGPAVGIHTEGLLYPLRGETLFPERTRGISNELVAASARVTVQSGQLIAIYTRHAARAAESQEENR